MGVGGREGLILPDGVEGGKREVGVEVGTEHTLQWPLRNGLGRNRQQ